MLLNNQYEARKRFKFAKTLHVGYFLLSTLRLFLKNTSIYYHVNKNALLQLDLSLAG